jgi:hypothetical protein
VGRRDPPQVRLEQDKVCLLVIVRVRADGTKELVALDDGHRESTESWADLLPGCKRRRDAAPVLVVGDGTLGFWAEVREVLPETREQRCWFHKIANVLNALPKSAQPGGKAVLAEIWNADDRDHARAEAKPFASDSGTKWPKAVAKITDDLDVLVEFHDYPAEHWVHLRTHHPDRVDLRHGPTGPAGHQGTRLARGRRRHGVQADRIRPVQVAGGQRTPPRRPRVGHRRRRARPSPIDLVTSRLMHSGLAEARQSPARAGVRRVA